MGILLVEREAFAMKKYAFIGWAVATAIWLGASFLWIDPMHTALLIVSIITGLATILSFMAFLVDRERRAEEDLYNDWFQDEEEH